LWCLIQFSFCIFPRAPVLLAFLNCGGSTISAVRGCYRPEIKSSVEQLPVVLYQCSTHVFSCNTKHGFRIICVRNRFKMAKMYFRLVMNHVDQKSPYNAICRYRHFVYFLPIKKMRHFFGWKFTKAQVWKRFREESKIVYPQIGLSSRKFASSELRRLFLYPPVSSKRECKASTRYAHHNIETLVSKEVLIQCPNGEGIF
jgi:hypothetical protein